MIQVFSKIYKILNKKYNKEKQEVLMYKLSH